MALAPKMPPTPCKCDECERARAGGDWGNVEYEDGYGPWEETPRWHPARLLGWKIRRCIVDHPRFRLHEFANPKKVARKHLERTYGKRD